MSNGVAGSLSGADLQWYNTQVSALRNLAKAACLERQAELETEEGDVLEFDLGWTEKCEDAVLDEDPFLATECVKHEGDCSTDVPIPGTGGEEQVDDSGSDGGGPFVYGLTDYDDVIDGRDPAQVDVDFVDDLLADLQVFEDDNIGVILSNSPHGYGFKFQTLGAESLPVALGFDEDDVVITVNGDPLASIADVTSAFETLNQEHAFTVRVSRNGSITALTFELTDLTTYP